jgi:hypothetical protein
MLVTSRTSTEFLAPPSGLSLPEILLTLRMLTQTPQDCFLNVRDKSLSEGTTKTDIATGRLSLSKKPETKMEESSYSCSQKSPDFNFEC